MNIKDIISTILKNETDARIISAVAAISGSLFEGNSVENVFPLVNPCEAVEEYSEADIAKCKSPILIRNYFKGGAVVAAFNLGAEKKPCYGSVRAIDAGLKNKGGYIYNEFFSEDFGYVNADEDIYFMLDSSEPVKYFVFLRKNEYKPLFLGRIDCLNGFLAIEDRNEDTVILKNGGRFAFVCDDDYSVYDAKGDEIDYDRIGLVCTGACEKDNLSLKFIKDDY
jgi:hypothetical protein